MNNFRWFMEKKRFILVFVGTSGGVSEVARYYHPKSAYEDAADFALGGGERLYILFDDDSKLNMPSLYAQSVNHLQEGISRPIIELVNL